MNTLPPTPAYNPAVLLNFLLALLAAALFVLSFPCSTPELKLHVPIIFKQQVPALSQANGLPQTIPATPTAPPPALNVNPGQPAAALPARPAFTQRTQPAATPEPRPTPAAEAEVEPPPGRPADAPAAELPGAGAAPDATALPTPVSPPLVPRSNAHKVAQPLTIPAFPAVGKYAQYSWLAFAALLPLLLLAWRNPPRAAFGWGYFTGILWLCFHLNWISSFGLVPVVLLSLYFALPVGLFTYLAHWVVRSRRARWIAWGVPALWTALEFLRSFGFWAFPWNLLGYSQTQDLPILQVAELGGVFAVSYAVALGGTALFLLCCPLEGRRQGRSVPLTERREAGQLVYAGLELPEPDHAWAYARRQRFGHGLCAVAAVLLLHGYGALRLWQIDSRQPAQALRLGLVQGGMETKESWSAPGVFERALQAYVTPSRSALVAWQATHPAGSSWPAAPAGPVVSSTGSVMPVAQPYGAALNPTPSGKRAGQNPAAQMIERLRRSLLPPAQRGAQAGEHLTDAAPRPGAALPPVETAAPPVPSGTPAGVQPALQSGTPVAAGPGPAAELVGPTVPAAEPVPSPARAALPSEPGPLPANAEPIPLDERAAPASGEAVAHGPSTADTAPVATPDPPAESGVGAVSTVTPPAPPPQPAPPPPVPPSDSAHPAYLLVWPEACIPRTVYPPISGSIPGEVQGLLQGRSGCGVLYGAAGNAHDMKRYENGAILLDGHNPAQWVYSKVRLVTYGEVVPFRGLVRFLEYPWGDDDISEGRTVMPFTYAGHKLGTLVCFDNVFGFVSRRAVQEGAEGLLLITNNSWYDLPSGIRQHCDMDILRAVETRRALGRAATTGWSQLVQPSGRVSDTSKLKVQALVEQWMPLSKQPSVYTLVGDVFAQLCLLGASLLCLRLLLVGKSEGFL